MGMDARELSMVVAVAEHGTFTEAARQLHLSQSAVSSGIRSLERELGALLFHRTTRRVKLTSIGELVVEQARVVEQALRRIRDLSASAADAPGRVRLGYFSGLDPALGTMTASLHAFRQRYPRVEVELVTSARGSVGLLEMLRAGELDLAMTGLPGADLGGLEHARLATQDLVLLVSRDHRLSGRAAIALSDLADEDFVEPPAGFATRMAVDTAFAGQSLSRRVKAEAPDLAAVEAFVAAGVGVAVVPPPRSPHTAVHVVRLLDPITWSIRVVGLPGDGLSWQARALLAGLRDGQV